MIHDEQFGSLERRRALTIFVLAVFALLMMRLYQLQLLYHVELDKKSEENSVRGLVKDPVRGYIYDRNGKLIVDVGPAYSVTLVPAEFEKRNIPLLSSILQMEPQTLEERIARARAYSPFIPARIKRDIDMKTLAAIEEHLTTLRGVSFQVESKRVYPTGAYASHLLGYRREISDAQLSDAGEGYRQGDLVGVAGLEARYEQLLKGIKGFEYVSVNSKGQIIGSFEDGRRDVGPKEGDDLLLSVDVGLQAFAESLMTNYSGGIVAMDPRDGGILALVSKPDYDPSIMSGVTPADLWYNLQTNPAKPLYNRATLTRYPPGSTFKMVLAAAALQEGVIDENFRIHCTGGFRFGNRVFKDLHVHGSVNVVEAIQKSCNVFFYQLMLKVGFDRWTEYGRRFGFGQTTNTDTGEETTGLLPSTQYYDSRYGKGKWTQGYLISLAIGQGEVGVSPLQMARYASALANGGTVYQPHAVELVRNKKRQTIDSVPHDSSLVGLSPHVMELIREGMQRVVHAPGGTGSLARIPGVISAGKTGTAENTHGKDHAWYVGFAPFENPKIAVAVMLENSGFGGAKAAPLAGLVMERYLYGELIRNKPKAVQAQKSVAGATAPVAH
ncbi:MAG: penicillin-binding protein 2 [Ignavibacteriales bacterium]|nr:penicillin-binding protein 2 [Ignavibacteriales bacterium]